MKRRGFLLGIGAALAAPAIVRAESLMKLWVPKRELLIAESLEGVMLSLPPGDLMTSGQVFFLHNVSKQVMIVTGLDRAPFWLKPDEQWRSA